MRKEWIQATLFISIASALLFLVTEGASYYYNSFYGKATPFLVSRNLLAKKFVSNKDKGEAYSLIDPHLGYSKDPNEEQREWLSKNGYEWKAGFIIYRSLATEGHSRPIILTLGGSTTDGLSYGHSWPEELAKLIALKKLPGTVINGGTGGYSSNQELLKLLRDGLSFQPDIVISYGGINDRGRYSKRPYPMVHRSQKKRLEAQRDGSPSIILPSTIATLNRLISRANHQGYTLGIESSLTLGQHYIRNMQIMNAISELHGIRFLGVLQPCAFCKKEDVWVGGKGERYRKNIRLLYDEIVPQINQFDFMSDATALFAGVHDVYKSDGVHLLLQGDKLVAGYIFENIRPELEQRQRTLIGEQTY